MNTEWEGSRDGGGGGRRRRREARGGGEHVLAPHTGGHLDLLHLSLLQSLGLGSAVLEPDLHLGLRQGQHGGELGPLGDGQVLLLEELPLQGQELGGGEGGPGLAVGFVFSQ